MCGDDHFLLLLLQVVRYSQQRLSAVRGKRERREMGGGEGVVGRQSRGKGQAKCECCKVGVCVGQCV